MMTAPRIVRDLDERIAALNRSLNRWAIHKDDMPILCALVADLEASRPTPGRPDDPKDAENAKGADLCQIWAEALEANPEMSTTEIATVSGDYLPAEFRALAEQFDAVTRRVEALEAENTHLRTQAGLPPIKTPWEQAMRETIDGQGLSMVAMGKELREKDEKIKALEAEVGRLRHEVGLLTIDNANLIGRLPAPAADHTERARKLIQSWIDADIPIYAGSGLIIQKDIELDVAAERAGAEKMRERAAKLCEPKHKPKVNMSRGEHGRIAASQGYAVYSEREQLAARVRALPLPGEE